MVRRIALELLAGAQERQRHRPARGGQTPRGDEAIASIVAGPAEHQNRAGLFARHHRIGDRPAGPLHQLDPGDPGLHGQPVRAVHLLQGKQR